MCKGKMAVLQGPTGVGKSSLMLQWSILLCLGYPFFGIAPIKPMKVLIIQAENDLGDIAEAFQDMIDSMTKISQGIGKYPIDVEVIRKNLKIVSNDSSTWDAFADTLSRQIAGHEPDIVFVDPLLAYIGKDMLKQENVSAFLRNMIGPILRQTGVTLFWIHHIVKPGGNANGQEKSAEQNKYSGLGSSELQNACREVISLSELSPGLFTLAFTKRGGRLGLRDRDGKPIREFNIEHSPDGIMWLKSEGDKATANKAKAGNIEAEAMVLKFIVNNKTVTLEQIRAWASKTKGIGIQSAIDYAKSFAADETPRENRIYKYKKDAPIGLDGKKIKGEQPTVYSTIKPKCMQDMEDQKCDLEREEIAEQMELGKTPEEREHEERCRELIRKQAEKTKSAKAAGTYKSGRGHGETETCFC
jgi:hypothetical protein